MFMLLYYIVFPVNLKPLMIAKHRHKIVFYTQNVQCIMLGKFLTFCLCFQSIGYSALWHIFACLTRTLYEINIFAIFSIQVKYMKFFRQNV